MLAAISSSFTATHLATVERPESLPSPDVDPAHCCSSIEHQIKGMAMSRSNRGLLAMAMHLVQGLLLIADWACDGLKPLSNRMHLYRARPRPCSSCRSRPMHGALVASLHLLLLFTCIPTATAQGMIIFLSLIDSVAGHSVAGCVMEWFEQDW